EGAVEIHARTAMALAVTVRDVEQATLAHHRLAAPVGKVQLPALVARRRLVDVDGHGADLVDEAVVSDAVHGRLEARTPGVAAREREAERVAHAADLAAVDHAHDVAAAVEMHGSQIFDG